MRRLVSTGGQTFVWRVRFWGYQLILLWSLAAFRTLERPATDPLRVSKGEGSAVATEARATVMMLAKCMVNDDGNGKSCKLCGVDVLALRVWRLTKEIDKGYD